MKKTLFTLVISMVCLGAFGQSWKNSGNALRYKVRAPGDTIWAFQTDISPNPLLSFNPHGGSTTTAITQPLIDSSLFIANTAWVKRLSASLVTYFDNTVFMGNGKTIMTPITLRTLLTLDTLRVTNSPTVGNDAVNLTYFNAHSVTANQGLTKTGSVIQWGGSLQSSASVTATQHSMSLVDTGFSNNVQQLFLGAAAFLRSYDTGSGETAILEATQGTDSHYYFNLSAQYTGGLVQITSKTSDIVGAGSGFLLQDDADLVGGHYKADYHVNGIANYGNRWIGDAGWVNSQILIAVPSQTSNSGKYLTTNGTVTSWATVPGGGGTTTNALTVNNGGSGTASPFTFDGSVAQTLSYNSIGAQAALGFTPENVANKATNFTTLNNTKYPTTQAVATYVATAGAVNNLYTADGTTTTTGTRTLTLHTGGSAGLLFQGANTYFYQTNVGATISAFDPSSSFTHRVNLAPNFGESELSMIDGSSNVSGFFLNSTSGLLFRDPIFVNGVQLDVNYSPTGNPYHRNLADFAAVQNKVLQGNWVDYATTAALPANTYTVSDASYPVDNYLNSGVVTAINGSSLVATANGTLTIDGTTVTNGKLILVKNETDQTSNGIYQVANQGSVSTKWALSRLYLNYGYTAGGQIYVQNGTLNGAKFFNQTTAGAITFGTTNIVYTAVVPVGANPTGTQGLTVVNGSAGTFMRSDATFPFNQALAPTNTALWTFTGGATSTTNFTVKKTAANSPSYLINDGSGNELARIVSDDNSNYYSGYQAGNNNVFTNSTSGSKNTYIGSQAGFSSITGYNNTAVGTQALYSNTGIYNTAVGYQALYSNTSGQTSTAFGVFALMSNTTGSYNNAIGFRALQGNISGTDNQAIGYNVLVSNTTGSANVAIGSLSTLSSNTTGSNNVAIGYLALATNISGVSNTAIGINSLARSTGDGNTALGSGAGNSITTGSYNTTLGYNPQVLTTGSYNILLGARIDAVSATNSGQLNIGNVLYGINLYQTALNSSTPTATGSIGIGLTTPTARLHLPAGTATAGTAPLKFTAGTNVSPIENGAMEYDGTHIYMSIGGVRYQLDQQSGGTTSTLTLGYGLTGTSFNGGSPVTTTVDTASSTGIVSKSRLATNLGGYVPYTGATGNVNLGTNFIAAGASLTPLTAIHAISTISTNPRGILSDQNTADAVGARITMRKSRGTPSSPTVITTGDVLGSWTASGYTNAYTDAGKVLVTSTGTISNGVVPSIMEFQTMTTGGTLTDGIKIDQAQALTFGAYGTGLLHSGSAGAVTSSLLVNADITAGTITNASLANSAITINGTSVSLGGTRTLSLASSDFVNQGTTTGVLHGNASGNPSFGQIVNADITNATIDLTSKVTGILPNANTTATATPTASAILLWDANKNLSANSYLAGYTTTVTAVGTTTLTVASTPLQYFTGTSNQTVLLPVASTLVLGQQYIFNNMSTGTVSVQSSGANVVIAVAGGNSAMVTCISTSGTGAGSWQANAMGNTTITGTGADVKGTNPTISGTMTVSAMALGLTGSNNTLSTNGGTAVFGQTNVAVYQLNGSTNISYRTGFYGSSSSTLSASASYAGVVFAGAPITTNTSGTNAILTNVGIAASAFTLGTGSTTTFASSFYIDGPPTTSGSGTLTNPVLALLVKTGNVTFNNGNLTLGTAGNRLFITEGSNAPVGQVVLVSGTKAITITGLTTSSRAFVQRVSPSGASLTVEYDAVCTSNTLTIQADLAATTINTADGSTVNYFIIN